MDNIETELMLMRLWPAIMEENYDGWILRCSGGYTKRSNCVNPMSSSSLSLEEKFKYCEEFYYNKKLPLIYKIIDSQEILEVDEFLAKKGLNKQNEVSVEEIYISKEKFSENDTIIKWRWDEKWFDFFSKETELKANEKEVLKRILQKNSDNTYYVRREINNETVACALGVVEKENLAIFSVYVKKAYREMGFGEDVLKGILKEASKIGVTKGYLQVLENNKNALNLYKKMGFVQKYRCWYRY